jgi:hypothetical protein
MPVFLGCVTTCQLERDASADRVQYQTLEFRRHPALPTLMTIVLHQTSTQFISFNKSSRPPRSMAETSKHEASSSSYIVILSGSHVIGKKTIAVSLSKSLDCPWLKGEFAAASADVVSRSHEKRGYDFGTLYGRTWFKKMQRIGLMSDGSESDGGGDSDTDDRGKKKFRKETGCLAIVNQPALRKPGRDAIRNVMLAKDVRVIFVILQITTDTLSGRTLGAENPELAERIMKEKAEDLREPEEEETDVLVVDSMQDIDALTLNIETMIKHQVAVG